jgi:hypothetical protein
MKIVMKEGFELTSEIENKANQYDFYYLYIDNYGQMKDAEANNDQIMRELRELGVDHLEMFE